MKDGGNVVKSCFEIKMHKYGFKMSGYVPYDSSKTYIEDVLGYPSNNF